MKVLEFIYGMPGSVCSVIRKCMDWIAFIILMMWFYFSYQYYFNYDSFYSPNAVVLEHYFNVTVPGWLFLMGHYNTMQEWGKATLLTFTGLLLVNSYQIHIHFDEFNFILFVGMFFVIIFSVYVWFTLKFIIEFFNPKY